MIHFSHPHELELWGEIGSGSVYQSSLLMLPLCACCKLPASQVDSMYYCLQCNYGLHPICAEFPRLLNHPGHRNHTLALLPTSAYAGGVFNCDACNRPGNGFTYHCSSCEYDLHVSCASRPLQITLLHFHPCPLELTFNNPYESAKGFSCDVCRMIGMKEWLYRCGACEFDVHLDCAEAEAVHGGHAGVLHAAGMGNSGQSHSLRALMGPHQIMHGGNPMAQSLIEPGNGAAAAAAAVSVHAQVGNQNLHVHGAGSGQLGNVPPQSGQSGLMNISVIQGLLDVGAQGVDQGLVLIGDGHGGGDGGGGGGIAPSITGNVFGLSSRSQN